MKYVLYYKYAKNSDWHSEIYIKLYAAMLAFDAEVNNAYEVQLWDKSEGSKKLKWYHELLYNEFISTLEILDKL